ncbi:MAG: family 31 glucosidase, partial [Treponema sp.]|nr:family 31 glucosidase [Treponema sp.]
MSSFFRIEKNRLVWDYNHETLWLEPWGKDGLRIRSTVADKMDENDWALLAPEKRSAAITEEESSAKIVNGKISAVVTAAGKITFYNQAGTVLLEEFVRNRRNVLQDCSALELEAREFKPAAGKIFRITVRFESEPEEKLYGMGQYQQEFLNLKNCSLELAQRNSQASVPFLLSNLGYGFLWNNPAVGKAVFSKNITEWTALSSAQIDYWITAGDT